MKKLSIEQFIRKSKLIHHDKYDYSKVEYINSRTKICIICPEHGEFWQKPRVHLKGSGCPLCYKENNHTTLLSTESFIEKAKKIHGDKYDYSYVKYINAKTPVCIICPEHGEFWQKPNYHLSGNGCQKCANRYIPSTEEFITRAKQVHGDKYDYSKVEYKNNRTKICIVCPEHGEFWQTPSAHIQGQGCPKCNESKLESRVKIFLTEKNIKFVCQKRFTWLGKQSLDFYLPDYNVAIECQGLQHYKPIKHFGGIKEFKKRVILDKKKKALCEKNGVFLFYFNYNDKLKKLNNIIV